jgi:hypothetical protein
MAKRSAAMFCVRTINMPASGLRRDLGIPRAVGFRGFGFDCFTLIFRKGQRRLHLKLLLEQGCGSADFLDRAAGVCRLCQLRFDGSALCIIKLAQGVGSQFGIVGIKAHDRPPVVLGAALGPAPNLC